MKNIVITILLVGAIRLFYSEVLEGQMTESVLFENHGEMPLITNDPVFSMLDSSLYLTVHTNQVLGLEDGAVVEFVFEKKRFRSYHVVDKNYELLENGKADLLVMIQQDLAFALKSERLIGIKVINGDQITDFEIKEFWQPHNYISQL